MIRHGNERRVLAVLALLLGSAIVAAMPGTVAAQENGLASITIYKAVCPAGYVGVRVFYDCYETPGVGYTFTLSGPGSADRSTTTGADGYVTFAEITNATAGAITFSVTETAPGPLHNFIVFCSEDGQPFPIDYLEAGISLGLMFDNDIRCDWYNIPAAGAANPAPSTPGGTDSPPTSGSNGTTTLPNTGAGASGPGAIPAGAPWVLAVTVVALVLGLAGPRLTAAPRIAADPESAEFVMLSAANRVDVLVEAGGPGAYDLVLTPGSSQKPIADNDFLSFGVDGAPFDTERPPYQIKLDTAEEWTLVNGVDNKLADHAHDFRIHVNPFKVTKINGAALANPRWRGTFVLTRKTGDSITFESNFLDFTGMFVDHCHVVAHGDLGMMESLAVVP